MDKTLLLIIKVAQNGFTGFFVVVVVFLNIYLLEQLQLRGSEETARAVRECCGEYCFANSENCDSTHCSSLLLHPPPHSLTDLSSLFVHGSIW